MSTTPHSSEFERLAEALDLAVRQEAIVEQLRVRVQRETAHAGRLALQVDGIWQPKLEKLRRFLLDKKWVDDEHAIGFWRWFVTGSLVEMGDPHVKPDALLWRIPTAEFNANGERVMEGSLNRPLDVTGPDGELACLRMQAADDAQGCRAVAALLKEQEHLARSLDAENRAPAAVAEDTGVSFFRGKTTAQLARSVTCTHQTIRRWAKDAGIPRERIKGDLYSIEEIRKILHVGMSQEKGSYRKKCAELLGRSFRNQAHNEGQKTNIF